MSRYVCWDTMPSSLASLKMWCIVFICNILPQMCERQTPPLWKKSKKTSIQDVAKTKNKKRDYAEERTRIHNNPCIRTVHMEWIHVEERKKTKKKKKGKEKKRKKNEMKTNVVCNAGVSELRARERKRARRWGGVRGGGGWEGKLERDRSTLSNLDTQVVGIGNENNGVDYIPIDMRPCMHLYIYVYSFVSEYMFHSYTRVLCILHAVHALTLYVYSNLYMHTWCIIMGWNGIGNVHKKKKKKLFSLHLVLIAKLSYLFMKNEQP